MCLNDVMIDEFIELGLKLRLEGLGGDHKRRTIPTPEESDEIYYARWH